MGPRHSESAGYSLKHNKNAVPNNTGVTYEIDLSKSLIYCESRHVWRSKHKKKIKQTARQSKFLNKFIRMVSFTFFMQKYSQGTHMTYTNCATMWLTVRMMKCLGFRHRSLIMVQLEM